MLVLPPASLLLPLLLLLLLDEDLLPDVREVLVDLVEVDGLQVERLLALRDGVLDVDALLALHQVHQLVRVLAHDDGAEVAGHVVPRDAVLVAVVQHRQAGLVVVLLETLDGDANVELGVERTLGDALGVVRLLNAAPKLTKHILLPFMSNLLLII